MKTNRTMILLVFVLGLTILSCKTLLPGTPTTAPIQPTPTSGSIKGIESPITVNGAELLIVLVTNDTTLYDSGPFSVQTQPGQTVLHIEAKIVSGNIDLGTFAKGISLTDESGNQCPLVSYGSEKPFWEFMAPKASKSFTLHFSDGQTIKLDSILKMVP